MAKLIYTALASLDGFIEDEGGKFDWAAPDEEVHAFVNDLERPVGTHLLGRRMYEVLSYWETVSLDGQPPYIRDFAQIWRAADKIVYSKTLATAPTARTRVEREFDAEAVRELKASAERDLTVGGPALAAHAFEAALVDEVPPLPLAGARRRRQACSSRSCPPEARAAGRARIRQRHRLPPLPGRRVGDVGSAGLDRIGAECNDV